MIVVFFFRFLLVLLLDIVARVCMRCFLLTVVFVAVCSLHFICEFCNLSGKLAM